MTGIESLVRASASLLLFAMISFVAYAQGPGPGGSIFNPGDEHGQDYRCVTSSQCDNIFHACFGKAAGADCYICDSNGPIQRCYKDPGYFCTINEQTTDCGNMHTALCGGSPLACNAGATVRGVCGLIPHCQPPP